MCLLVWNIDSSPLNSPIKSQPSPFNARQLYYNFCSTFSPKNLKSSAFQVCFPFHLLFNSFYIYIFPGIVAATAKSSKTDYSKYADKYTVKYNKSKEDYYKKYAKKWVDKYGSTVKPTTMKPTTVAVESVESTQNMTTAEPATTSTYDYDKYTTNGAKAGSSIKALLNHFNLKDAADVTWAHAVNSKKELDEALGDEKIMMLEADVILDPVANIPIMGHPPANTSDLTLEAFLVHSLKHWEEKGIKLDFKQDEAVKASAPIMKKIFGMRKKLPPIILNADILVGPNTNENETTPVDAEIFFNTFAPFRYAILSPGWTTKFIGNTSEGYNNTDANEMTKIVQQFKVQQDVTFPVRASLVVLNHKPMHLLLNQMQDKTSLTVWTSKTDVYDPKDLGFLRLYTKKVFFDLPQEEIDAIKDAGFVKNIPEGVIPGIGKDNMPF